MYALLCISNTNQFAQQSSEEGGKGAESDHQEYLLWDILNILILLWLLTRIYILPRIYLPVCRYVSDYESAHSGIKMSCRRSFKRDQRADGNEDQRILLSKVFLLFTVLHLSPSISPQVSINPV